MFRMNQPPKLTVVRGDGRAVTYNGMYLLIFEPVSHLSAADLLWSILGKEGEGVESG